MRMSLLLVASLWVSGCAACMDYKDEWCTTYNHRKMAKTAWSHACHKFGKDPYHEHFGDGFKAGYFDAIRGKDPCPPTLPPRDYWSSKNKGPCAPARTAAWFDGYVTGSIQAHIDGVAGCSRVVLSPAGHAACPSLYEWPTEGPGPYCPDLQPIPEPAIESVPYESAPLAPAAIDAVPEELIVPPAADAAE